MTDHTGPNTGPGGCHGGLLSRRYQRLLSTEVVAAAPSPAVAPTAPRINAASRPVRPVCKGSTAATFRTLPPPLSDPDPAGQSASACESPAEERVRSATGKRCAFLQLPREQARRPVVARHRMRGYARAGVMGRYAASVGPGGPVR